MTILNVQIEPFSLYRFLMSIVLGGIAVYTTIDSIVSIASALRKHARVKSEVAEAHSQAATGLSQAAILRRERIQVIANRSLRVGRKYAILKGLEVLSLKSVARYWRLLVSIALLAAANAFSLWYFYTM